MPATDAPARGCPRRRLPPGGPRPSDLLARCLLNAVAYLLAAAVAGAWSAATGSFQAHWLALHLAFVGAVSLMVLGAGQFFATAFLMTTPPGRRMVGAQLAVWNGGTLLVAVGVTRGHPRLADAGAGLLLAGLALFALALRGLTRRSLQRSHWAVRWYLASAAFLALGAVAGALLEGGGWVPPGTLLGAHVTLNVGGWFGTAIVGTLHTFYPSLTQTRLRHPRAQAWTFRAWCAGIATLAAGYLLGSDAAVVTGWAALALAAAILAANLAASRRAATAELRLPARLVGAGQLFLVAGVTLGVVGAVRFGAVAPVAGPQRTALAFVLAGGWVGLTVAGSLLHLLMVLARVRAPGTPLPPPRPRRDRALTAVAAGGLAAAALAHAPHAAALAAPGRAAVLAATAALAALAAAELASIARTFRRRA